jgi:glyoxylase-like metal-dependent hydrolase (beta-lactamase superfamily II)
MRITMTLLVAIVLAAPLAADNPETAVERSHERAKRVLDAAVDAIGGRAAVEGVKAVRIRLGGEQFPRFQSVTPEPPHTPGRYQEETVIDLEQNRLAVVQTNKGAGFRGNGRIVLAGNKGQTFDLLNRTATSIDAANAQQQQFAQYQRRLPSLILRTALQRDATLRYVGEDTVNGAAHNVITFVHVDGLQMALYVDAKTNLISKYELIYPDAVTGDEASEIYFEGYHKVGTLQVPATFLWKQAGDVVAKWSYEVEFNPQLADATFDDKTDGFRLTPNPALAAQQRKVGVEKLGDGVYLVNNLGGGFYNVMAVEFANHVVAVEAPLGSQVSEQAIAEIKKAIPNKPITFVAMTHHHSDHSGGLRAFVAEGATVVTTPGNAGYVKALVASKQLRDGLATSPKPLKLELIENKKRVFSDGTQTLELHDIGPNSHAREMLVGYLPKQRIVFQGDLFFSPYDGQPIGFAQESTQEFAARLRALGLSVDKLAGVHGKVGTMSELDEALELAKKVESRGVTDRSR